MFFQIENIIMEDHTWRRETLFRGFKSRVSTLVLFYGFLLNCSFHRQREYTEKVHSVPRRLQPITECFITVSVRLFLILSFLVTICSLDNRLLTDLHFVSYDLLFKHYVKSLDAMRSIYIANIVTN